MKMKKTEQKGKNFLNWTKNIERILLCLYFISVFLGKLLLTKDHYVLVSKLNYDYVFTHAKRAQLFTNSMTDKPGSVKYMLLPSPPIFIETDSIISTLW